MEFQGVDVNEVWNSRGEMTKKIPGGEDLVGMEFQEVILDFKDFKILESEGMDFKCKSQIAVARDFTVNLRSRVSANITSRH